MKCCIGKSVSEQDVGDERRTTFDRSRHCLGAIVAVLQRTLFDLLGPIIDPIGYQIELETYVANIMRGPSNLYITCLGYVASAAMFFHFFVDPFEALLVSFWFLRGQGFESRVGIAGMQPYVIAFV